MSLVNLEHCPYFMDHTPAPSGYIQWHAWAEDMSKTHRQKRCTGCGLFQIWVPKRAIAALKSEV